MEGPKIKYMPMEYKTIKIVYITSMYRQAILYLGMPSISRCLHLLVTISNTCSRDLMMLSSLPNYRVSSLNIQMLFMRELFPHLEQLYQLKLL